MYKQYIRLKLNNEGKPLYRIQMIEDRILIEVHLLNEDEKVDLSQSNIEVVAKQSNGKNLFKRYEVLPNKKGVILLDLMDEIDDFNVRLACELIIKNEDGTYLGKVTFYLVIVNEDIRSTSIKRVNLSPKIRLIAHRGLSALAPENTLPAYELAGKYGYYGAECDLHETKDGQFILLHDDLLNRTTNGMGKPESYTLEQLNGFVVNGGNQVKKYPHLKIPTLEQYLAVCKKWGLVPVIEIKEIEAKSVSRLLDSLAKWGSLQHVVIISFSKEIVTEIRKLNHEINIQWLSKLTKEAINYCAKYQMDIDCHKKHISKEMVDYAHSKGVLVNAWTVDSLDEMHKLIELGVDFISTNVLLYNQDLRSSGKIKSYLLDNRMSYVTCLHSSINGDQGNDYHWHETGIFEVRGKGDTKKMLQIKLPAMNTGDVITLSFAYRNISGEAIQAAIEYNEMNKATNIERSIQTKAINDWGYLDCQFVVMNVVNGNKDYYNVLIGSSSGESSHFMIRDVRIKIDYM